MRTIPIYPESFAAMLVDRAGQKYRLSGITCGNRVNEQFQKPE
jgi:hypothetical protein